jgi:Zn-dependent protease with chaperone function
MSEVRGWGAGTNRRAAVLLTLSVLASLVMLQELAERAGVRADASWIPAFAGTGLLLIAVVAGHLLISRRRPHLPVPVQVEAELDRLVAVAGLDRAPRYELNPLALTTGAVTRGRAGRYRLVLDAGLMCRRQRTPRRFAAVVLHELAHVRNRDVEVAQLTVALWRIVSVAVLLPYTVVNAWAAARGPRPTGPLRDVALALAVSVVLYLLYAQILRVRELYADRDAIAWGADPRAWVGDEPDDVPDTIRGLLLLLARTVLAGAGSSLAAVVRTHPTPGQRRRALAEPSSEAAATLVGDTIYSLVLMAAAIGLVLILLIRPPDRLPGGPAEWPGPLTALIEYPAVVVCVAGLTIAPSRRPEDGAVRYAPVAAHRRRRYAVSITAIFGAVTVLLLVFDPVHLFAGEYPRTLPPTAVPVLQPRTSWSVPQSAALAGLTRSWLRAHYSDLVDVESAVVDLRVKIDKTPPRRIDWPSFAPYCVALTARVDRADGLGDFPDADGRESWTAMRTEARAAVDVLCRHRYSRRAFGPLLTARTHLQRAYNANVDVQRVLTHYLAAG